MTHPTIMVVIADLFFLSKVTTALKAQGCSVNVATQLPQILKETLEQPFSLLILDLGISTLDPVTLLQEIRRTEALRKLPVLCYVNHTQIPAWQDKLGDHKVKVVPNSYISSNIGNVVGLINLFI